MKGCVYHQAKAAKDSWTVKISHQDPIAGKRIQRTYTVRGKKSDAEKFKREKLQELDQGLIVKSHHMTLREFLGPWVTQREESREVRPLTAVSDEHWAEVILARLGNIRLEALEPMQIQASYNELLKDGRKDGKGGLSAMSIVHIHRLLHHGLDHAVKLGLIGRNPADDISLPRPKRKEMKVLDEGQVSQVFESCKGTMYYSLYHLGIYSGLRRSEICGLQWDDIDMDRGAVAVVRTRHQLKGSKMDIEDTKTDASRRTFALSPGAVAALRQYKEQKIAERLLTGGMLKGTDFVFTDDLGKPLLPNTISHAWTKLVRRIGLAGVRLHDLRHTHATLFLKSGGNLVGLKGRLGHSTITTTGDIYAHWLPEMDREAALNFERMLRDGANGAH